MDAELGSRRIIGFFGLSTHCVLRDHPRHHAPVLGAQGRCELWSPRTPPEADKWEVFLVWSPSPLPQSHGDRVQQVRH